ncbi:MAG: hypothetical protein II573_00140, partial [Ruminococcus sp.]|nr:hypothetical protein [Ruminococcus sp.]
MFIVKRRSNIKKRKTKLSPQHISPISNNIFQSNRRCRQMKTEREKMTNAEPFLTNDPQLMEDKKNARLLCSRFNHSPEDEALRK